MATKRKPFSGLGLNQIVPVLQETGTIDLKQLTNISQSQPEPFTLAELEGLIGPVQSLLDPNLSLGFSPDQGREALRETISSLYQSTQPDQILTFTGAQEAIFCSLHALLQEGDQVIAIKPAYDAFIKMAEEIGCEMQYLHLRSKQNWKLDIDQLADLITDQTRLLIINYPHNPTGALPDKTEFDQIIHLCRKYNVWLLSDEVFRGLEHNPNDRLPAVVDAYEKAISIAVMSKAYALPAFRVGWAACQDASVLARMAEIKSYLSICNSQIDEIIICEALKNSDKILQRNRNQLLPLYAETKHFFETQQDHFIWTDSNAGCCSYVLFDQNVMSENEQKNFFRYQAEENGLYIIPSIAFLANEPGFRIGFGYKKNPELIRKI